MLASSERSLRDRRCYVVTKFQLKCIISMSRVGSRAAVSRSAAHLPRTNFYMVRRTPSQRAIGKLLLRDRDLRSSLRASCSLYRYLAVGRCPPSLHEHLENARLVFLEARMRTMQLYHARPEHCSFYMRTAIL
uniref:Uncharacterized protein n=1 Tax=Trichogramma kaykai TaxID=54128 RepID=A0ABD2WRM2_9HYME